jgi:membrane associated rhomboid family serine protease
MTPFAFWLDKAATNFRWSRFAPTADALALTLVVGTISGALLIDRAAFWPAVAKTQLCAFIFVPTVGGVLRQSATLFQHLFIHVDWAHLVGNLAFLTLLGSAASRRVSAESRGARRLRAFAAFSLFFATCGVVGGIVFVLTDRIAPSCTIGASGAIAGLFGAALRFAFRSADDEARDPRGFDRFDARAVAAIAAVIAANAALSAAGALLKAPWLVTAWQAHAGGVVFGAIAFPWFARLAR